MLDGVEASIEEGRRREASFHLPPEAEWISSALPRRARLRVAALLPGRLAGEGEAYCWICSWKGSLSLLASRIEEGGKGRKATVDGHLLVVEEEGLPFPRRRAIAGREGDGRFPTFPPPARASPFFAPLSAFLHVRLSDLGWRVGAWGRGDFDTSFLRAMVAAYLSTEQAMRVSDSILRGKHRVGHHALLLLSLFAVCFRNDMHCVRIGEGGEATLRLRAWEDRKRRRPFSVGKRQSAFLALLRSLVAEDGGTDGGGRKGTEAMLLEMHKANSSFLASRVVGAWEDPPPLLDWVLPLRAAEAVLYGE